MKGVTINGRRARRTPWLPGLLFAFPIVAGMNAATAEQAAAELPTKVLFDPAAIDAAKQVALNGSSQPEVACALADNGIEVTVAADGKSSFPGIVITPPAAWDLSAYGRIDARIVNLGASPLNLSLRADDDGPWQNEPYSAGKVTLKPHESGSVTAIFHYKWGKKDHTLNTGKITKLIFFAGKSSHEQKFRIEAIHAAGHPGEKPCLDQNKLAFMPPGGVIAGPKAAFDPAKQAAVRGGAKFDPATLTGTFTPVGEQSIVFKPAVGVWNLNEYLQVKVRVKNTGATSLTPFIRLESTKGPTDAFRAAAPVAPGDEADIFASFVPPRPWRGLETSEMLDSQGPAHVFEKEHEPGTGSVYASNATNGIVVGADRQEGSLQVLSIIAEMPPRQSLPEWLGKRPPVEGDWSLTFEDNFSGNAIDLHKWNIYSEGDWHLGKETAWSKDNVIVKNDLLYLRLEKRKARHNDDPNQPILNYATGNCDTYGKWTQRYGYFEARLKMPATPNSFTAFWMMPDRGLAYEMDPKKTGFGETRHFRRDSTNGNGMEFDIMEQLSIWGPNRHDAGMHWDFYLKNHKSIGTLTLYHHPDAEGFVTVGMLWTPGQAIIYQQGKEVFRWECKRIGSVPSYFILQHISGGWETEGFDDAKLPADMIFDYVRAWQRKDLASDMDGPKPNDGGPRAPKAPEPKAP
ncbi:MAG: glycoside hydrolase family 16 protein [Planctomycetes bacterium]|nr:glycoside hydrolase family 16 protein [Planctomycetota bacterium]